MEVSRNGGTPEWLVYNGKSRWNGWWLGVPLWLRKPPNEFNFNSSFWAGGHLQDPFLASCICLVMEHPWRPSLIFETSRDSESCHSNHIRMSSWNHHFPTVFDWFSPFPDGFRMVSDQLPIVSPISSALLWSLGSQSSKAWGQLGVYHWNQAFFDDLLTIINKDTSVI